MPGTQDDNPAFHVSWNAQQPTSVTLDPTPMTHDLCIAWNWEHDADFVALLAAACREHGLSLLQITPQDLESACLSLESGEWAFRALLDRASDADPRFLRIVEWARQQGVRRINAYEKARCAWNKATMHLEFITAGLQVPYALILPPFHERADLPPLDLSVLGPTFSIKPACRGGGEGVVNAATSWSEVLIARQQYPHDGYLLQANVLPVQLGPRPAWFRVIYCGGHVFSCWWDVATHIYAPISTADEIEYALSPLHDVATRIVQVCDLELFSTEVALTADGHFIVVDYVNDPVDLRLQSKAADGVPDAMVRAIADDLARWVKGDR